MRIKVALKQLSRATNHASARMQRLFGATQPEMMQWYSFATQLSSNTHCKNKAFEGFIMNERQTSRAHNTRVKLKDIYRSYLGKRGGQHIWVVDWNNVCRIYPDWIMGGNDQRYRFNPADEVWIDASMGIEEYVYTLQHELIEQRLMRDRLWTYDRAHDYANLTVDRKLRANNQKRIARKLKKLNEDGSPPGYAPALFEGVYKAFNGRVLGHEVWVVDGALIRQKLDVDIVFPGAHSMQRKYVPEGEIWLDNATSCEQLKLAMVELVAMLKAKQKGKSIDEAYELSHIARETERERQRKICAAHESAMPAVRTGARARGVKVPRNH